jgi:hypothetical protein
MKYLRPSSLGSYFGVGFNTPEQQFRYDTGQEEVVFDEESKERMALGNFFEDTILNYFETVLNVIITDRNTEVIFLYDGKLHGKVDGRTMFEGEKAVVEAKMSNSNYKKFTENVGYYIQAQCYMMDDPELKSTLLLGLQNGRPAFRIVKRDEEIIQDIKTMVDYILAVSEGINTWDNYPIDLVEKYSGSKPLPEIEHLEDFEIQYVNKLIDINEQIKVLEEEKKYIENHLKQNFGIGKYEKNGISVSLGLYSRKGGLDTDQIVIDFPHIDLEKYRLPDSSYKTLKVKKK